MTRLFVNHRLPVRLNGAGQPLTFYYREAWHPVERVVKTWRIATGWWAEPTERDYFQLITEDGMLVVVYLDLLGGEWYLSRLYD